MQISKNAHKKTQSQQCNYQTMSICKQSKPKNSKQQLVSH